MTMRIYKSTDASAPTLQGIVGGAQSGSDWADGSLLQLLRKVLVTGYGSKTAAGWTQAFGGTSEGVFQMGGGNQRYLHVLDDGSATAGAREAAMTGYGAMTAIATGTDQFPASGQNSGRLFWRKSETADTVQRSWIIYADNKTMWLFVHTGNSTAYYTCYHFGDFYSFVSGDAWNTILIGRATSAAVDTLGNDTGDLIANATFGAIAGHYIPRGYGQAGTSVQVGKAAYMFGSAAAGNQALAAVGALPYPNNADGKLWLSRIYIYDPSTNPTTGVRGFLRGLWAPQNAGSQIPFEYTVSGSGGLAGRTFKALGLRSAGNVNGRLVAETSDTWD